MRIVCGNCNTEYDIDLPPSALQRPNRNLKFRCSSCGRTFVTRLDAGNGESSGGRGGDDSSERGRSAKAAPTTTTPAPQAAAAPKTMLLKQEGKVYSVRDLSTLQRWIVERRVARDDLVSFGGTVFEPAGSRPEFESFFEIVEQADSPPPTTEAGEALPGEPPMPSGSWAPWERSNPPVNAAGAAPPVRADEPESSEVLPSLEADEDLDGMEEAAAALSFGGHGAAREPGALNRTEVPASALAPTLSRGGDTGPGVPTGFPMLGGGRAEAPASLSGPRSGVTSRDQVFDAFPMDMAPETPVRPPAPVGPSFGTTNPNITLAPIQTRPPEPAIHTLPASLPLDAPTPAPGLPAQELRRPPHRGLDWDDGRRPSTSNQTVVIAAVAVIVAFFAGVLLLWQRVENLASQPAVVATVATAPALSDAATSPAQPAAVVQATLPAVPVVSATEVTPTPGTPPPEATPVKAVVKSAGGGGSQSKVQKGWTLMDKGDYDGARSTCMDAVGAGVVGAEAWFCAGRAAEYQGDSPNAANFYCRSLSAGPDSETSAAVRGRLSSLGKSCP